MAIKAGFLRSADLQQAVNPAYRVWRDIAEDERQKRVSEVIRRFLNDERIADIANSMGLSRSALNMALLAYAQEDWRTAQVARAQSRLERAREYRERMAALFDKNASPEDLENGIACTTETLTLARDEEKSAQWELERLCRRIYGQDAPAVGSGLTITLNFNKPAAPHNEQIMGMVIDSDAK